MKFDKSIVIKNLNAKLEAEAKKKVDAVLNKIVDGLMELSPVGQPDDWAGSVPKDYEPGKYKANWQHSVDAPLTEVLDMRDESNMMEKDSSTSKHLKNSIKNNKKLLATHYFRNNVSYAEAIEYGSAIHNPQAQTKPHAVAGLVAQNIPRYVAEVMKEVK